MWRRRYIPRVSVLAELLESNSGLLPNVDVDAALGTEKMFLKLATEGIGNQWVEGGGVDGESFDRWIA